MSRLFGEKRSYAENIFWAVACFAAVAVNFAAAIVDVWVPGRIFFGFVAILGVKLGFGYLRDAGAVR